jgi:hypothetical protein
MREYILGTENLYIAEAQVELPLVIYLLPIGNNVI